MARPSASSARTGGGAPPASSPAETPDQVARRYRLAGELLVAKGDRILLDRGYGTLAPSISIAHQAGERWRLASITKQVTAAQVVRYLALNGPGALDASVDRRLYPQLAGVTYRQLLTHHSGLPNPDATPADADGVPSAYRRSSPDTTLCAPAKPGAPFAYNNCDYWILGGLRQGQGWPRGMAMARFGEIGVPGFAGGKPEPVFQLASWGAAGGLMGTARAVFDFDRSLMTGQLVPATIRDGELWKPEGKGSYQALGQWVFPGRLKGCAGPKRIVQRDGEIYGVQARNYILPDDDLVVIVFTNRSADDFAIGEVWEGKGFAYDLLSAAACA